MRLQEYMEDRCVLKQDKELGLYPVFEREATEVL